MINYFYEDVTFKVPTPIKTKKWLNELVTSEGFSLTGINYIFCSDEYLLQMNREHLDHDYYTDIITFDNSEDEDTIEGDIFISIDRVADNATTEGTEFVQELRRVLAHGVLHLCGYDDHSDEDRAEMRAKENYYISQFK